MNTNKITSEELKKIITEEALKIMSAGDPLGVSMNKMAKVDNKEGAAYVAVNKDGSFDKKKAKNIESSKEATEVKMNANDKEGGSDAKVATAVSVKASSSTKSGDSVEGLHNDDFDSKESGPKVATSKPFVEKEGEVDMTEMDKEGEDGAKTYVQPGAEMHKTTSTGQHKGKFSEKAPGPETIDRIAKGIQLPERFENKQALLSFINEEAKKVANLL
jgi:hypothetical protein